MTAPRYPLQALEQKLHLSDFALARQLGISHQTLRHLERVGLSWNQADRYAIRAGYHPTEIWPTYTADALNETLTPRSCRDQPSSFGAA